MDLVGHIKKFLSKQGLNWNGEIEYEIKTKKDIDTDFRMAEDSDFEKEGENQTIIIDFGENGQIALVVSIDLINFHIYGIDTSWALVCYAGVEEENVELCDDERDLSDEWHNYMLVNGGLVYRKSIMKLCEQKREDAEMALNSRLNDLDRKIGYLHRKKEYATQEYNAKIGVITDLEEKIKNFES